MLSVNQNYYSVIPIFVFELWRAIVLYLIGNFYCLILKFKVCKSIADKLSSFRVVHNKNSSVHTLLSLIGIIVLLNFTILFLLVNVPLKKYIIWVKILTNNKHKFWCYTSSFGIILINVLRGMFGFGFGIITYFGSKSNL